MKVAIITGASSGMGREMARAIDEKIPNVEELWLFGRRRERLREQEGALKKTVKVFGWDFLEEESLVRYETLLRKQSPEIVFLVNAAGFGKIGTVSDLSSEEQEGMLALNIRVLTMLCKLSIPYLSEKSRIINFASAAAFLPQPHFAVYAASKSYVLSFSRALNAELKKQGCHVLAVCPGPVKTEFFEIAETTGKIPLYKHLFMADAKKVVQKALVDSVLAREVSVYGLTMQAFALFSKILPQGLLLKVLA